jgi:hypothetical protein
VAAPVREREEIMKFTDAQRQELFDALNKPNRTIQELAEVVVADIDLIEPIICRWLTPECPECRLPVDAHDSECSRAGEEPIHQIVRDQKYMLRIHYAVRGDHTHFSIFTGKIDFTLGLAGEVCMTNEEFEAFMHGTAFMEFVESP